MYLCLVDGKESPNIFGIHTKRWMECPLYRKGLHMLKAVQHCLVNASKIGPEAVEKVIERLKEGKSVPEKCEGPEKCPACVCYVDGKCLLWGNK